MKRLASNAAASKSPGSARNNLLSPGTLSARKNRLTSTGSMNNGGKIPDIVPEESEDTESEKK